MTMRQDANPKDWYIPPHEPLRLRTSLIKMYLRCPAQALFRYFKGLIIPPRSYTIMGSCFHKSAEHHYAYKKEKGKNENLSVLQDVFNESFKYFSKITQWNKEEKPDEFKTEGIKRILPTYYEERAVILEPAYVEESFEVPMPEVNVILTGSVDLTLTNGHIRDHKLRKRTPNWLEPLKSIQAKSYVLGFKTKFKKKPAGFAFDYVVRKKEPEVITSKTVKHKDSTLDNFAELVKRVTMAIRRGEFYQRAEGNYLCSPTSCGYWDLCMNKGQWKDPGIFTQVFGMNSDKQADEDDS